MPPLGAASACMRGGGFLLDERQHVGGQHLRGGRPEIQYLRWAARHTAAEFVAFLTDVVANRLAVKRYM